MKKIITKKISALIPDRLNDDLDILALMKTDKNINNKTVYKTDIIIQALEEFINKKYNRKQINCFRTLSGEKILQSEKLESK